MCLARVVAPSGREALSHMSNTSCRSCVRKCLGIAPTKVFLLPHSGPTRRTTSRFEYLSTTEIWPARSTRRWWLWQVLEVAWARRCLRGAAPMTTGLSGLASEDRPAHRGRRVGLVALRPLRRGSTSAPRTPLCYITEGAMIDISKGNVVGVKPPSPSNLCFPCSALMRLSLISRSPQPQVGWQRYSATQGLWLRSHMNPWSSPTCLHRHFAHAIGGSQATNA